MKLTKWEFIGVVLISGLGVFLHYAYELSNNNQFVKLIAPINETMWEHFKMAFYAMVGFALFEYIFIGKEHKNFIFAKAFSAFLAPFLSVVLYYGYTNFLSPNLYLDILIFVVAILIAQIFSYAIIRAKIFVTGVNYIVIVALLAAVFVFCSYTYEPPHHDIFVETATHEK